MFSITGVKMSAIERHHFKEVNVQIDKAVPLTIGKTMHFHIIPQQDLTVFGELDLQGEEKIWHDIKPIDAYGQVLEKPDIDSTRKHKILSVLAVVLTVIVVVAAIALVAVLIANPITLAIGIAVLLGIALVGIIGGGIGSAVTWNALESMRLNQDVKNNLEGAGIMGAISLGLAIPIHYVIAAFSKKTRNFTLNGTKRQRANQDLAKMEKFIKGYGRKMEEKLDEKLNEAKKNNEADRIKTYQEAQEELSKVINFYNKSVQDSLR